MQNLETRIIHDTSFNTLPEAVAFGSNQKHETQVFSVFPSNIEVRFNNGNKHITPVPPFTVEFSDKPTQSFSIKNY